MPELPEVERGRKLAERVARGRRIVRSVCSRDDIVYDGVSPATFRRRVTGRTVVEVRRRGKHLWFELDERPWPLFHFGMTGAFRAPDEKPLRLASTGRRPDDGWPPRFTKLRLLFDDGGELALTNKRRLGRIRLRDDPAGEPPVSALGFDPLLDLPEPGDFAARVGRRRVTLKGLLLDQAFAAGVGNWIADEVLYQARLDPRRRASSLAPEEVRRLRAKLGHVVRTAVRVDAAKERFPRSWLFHRRWGKDSSARTTAGHRIRHVTLAGRTTAWVPAVQR
ncbi:MAG: Fpg/Nei family DNA glycosylase [Planctomycetota bacterium]|jgi:formamidopyrimidine-DNA glycosylase